MRSIRRFSQLILTVSGGALVVYAVYYVPTLRERVLYAGLGLLIMELGIWQVTSFLFPNNREFKPLRQETDYFLKLVRRLNRAAVSAEHGSANAREELDRVQEEMHHSVERMRRLAGVQSSSGSERVSLAFVETRQVVAGLVEAGRAQNVARNHERQKGV